MSVLDVEALYVALDRKRRALRISGAEVLRQSGVGTTSRSVWTRLAHGEGTSADNLVRLLLWLGETDVRPFVRSVPDGAERGAEGDPSKDLQTAEEEK